MFASIFTLRQRGRSRTLCHIDTVNSDSLGAWLWEHAKSKQLSIVLTFCEQGTDQGKMLSISVYFHKKTKTRRGLKQIILRVMKRDFCEMDIIFHKTEDWSSWSYILEFVLKLLILGNIMKLLSSIRELSSFFFGKMVTKTFFFYIRRYAREINCITFFLFIHLPLGASLICCKGISCLKYPVIFWTYYAIGMMLYFDPCTVYIPNISTLPF